MTALALACRAFAWVFFIAPIVWIIHGIQKNKTVHILGGVMLLLFLPIVGLVLFGRSA